jgi:hypothetical protein
MPTELVIVVASEDSPFKLSILINERLHLARVAQQEVSIKLTRSKRVSIWEK